MSVAVFPKDASPAHDLTMTLRLVGRKYLLIRFVTKECPFLGALIGDFYPVHCTD